MPPSGNGRGLGLTPFPYLPQHDLDLQICKATLGKPITMGRGKKRLANVLPMEWGCSAHRSVHYRSQVAQTQPLGQMPLEYAHSFLGPHNGSLMSPIPVQVERTYSRAGAEDTTVDIQEDVQGTVDIQEDRQGTMDI